MFITGGFGCLVFFCLVFNLFLGWMFLSFVHWFLVGAALLGLLLLQGALTARKAFSPFFKKTKKDKVIDVEATVIDEKKGLPERKNKT